MPLITASEINAIAFSTPIDPALILDEIIIAAETKFIIPAVTKPIYDDLSIHPGFYTTLVADYIKPYLAYCVKFLMYCQYLNEPAVDETILLQRGNIVNESSTISQLKKTLLINHLLSGIYPQYIFSVKKRITGFLINKK
jgi:hypothetical protein